MTSTSVLKALAAGRRPEGGEILPSCRMEAHGATFYSEEAIVEAFRSAPLLLGAAAVTVATDRHAAIFDGNSAIIADVYGTSIARIWRLGAGELGPPEPSLGVPFDPDLMQARGDLALRLEDHPQLSAAGAMGLEQAGRALARDWSPDEGPAPYRVRSFLVRAFSARSSTVGLFAVYRMSGGRVRASGYAYAAALLEDERPDPVIIRDVAAEVAIGTRQWITTAVSRIHEDVG